jgi:DNA (cytosine-5)-methyltransferase 1
VFVVGFRDGGEGFEFPEPVELRTTMQDFLEDSVAGKYFLSTKGVDFVTWDKNHRKRYTQIDGEVMLCQKANQQFNWHGDFVFVEENEGQHEVDEKYFLSQKVERYVLASGTKGFSAKPETDLEVARPILATLFKNHRAGVDNYVTTEGRLRMLTPKECLRLMGFCDSFEQTVSNIQMYRQAGNSIVVDVLIAIMAQSIPVLAEEDATFSSLKERAERIRELFDELPERQIQQSDLERVVAALGV